jgi:hypothetical protein
VDDGLLDRSLYLKQQEELLKLLPSAKSLLEGPAATAAAAPDPEDYESEEEADEPDDAGDLPPPAAAAYAARPAPPTERATPSTKEEDAVDSDEDIPLPYVSNQKAAARFKPPPLADDIFSTTTPSGPSAARPAAGIFPPASQASGAPSGPGARPSFSSFLPPPLHSKPALAPTPAPAAAPTATAAGPDTAGPPGVRLPAPRASPAASAPVQPPSREQLMQKKISELKQACRSRALSYLTSVRRSALG